MNYKKNKLIKIIKYRLSYTGTKETDILYQRIISKKISYLNYDELLLLSGLFNEISDNEIFNIITNKTISPDKYKDLLRKIIDE